MNINVLLLTIGMLGKQKGQILRVAASFQVLFSMNRSREGSGSNSDLNLIISDKALLASINFVELCCQQAAYIAGRGDIKDDIKNVKASKTVELCNAACVAYTGEVMVLVRLISPIETSSECSPVI